MFESLFSKLLIHWTNLMSAPDLQTNSYILATVLDKNSYIMLGWPVVSCEVKPLGAFHFFEKFRFFTCMLLWFHAMHNEPDVLSNQKTDLGSRGDVELLVLHLHEISSGLQHSSVIISLSVIVYVSQNVSSFARMCHNPKVWNYIYCNTIPSCQKDTKHFSSRRFGKSRDWREKFGLKEKITLKQCVF